MISIHEVREVHLELTTNCNASCPLCPRNFHGYPYNSGYPETELSLADIKKIFSPAFVHQLYQVKINGNLGDFMLATDALEIVEYFRKHNNSGLIDISTNGSARNLTFWQRLAQSRPKIRFALDGLEDTHHLYRQNTQFHRIIQNATSFITAGGHAVWKMVLFDHNSHQVEAAKKLSQDLGFAEFELVNHGRDKGPVYNKNGTLERILGHPQFKPQESVIEFMNQTQYYNSRRMYFGKRSPASKLNCQTMSRRKTIYIAADGSVYPCCWTGFYPTQFDTALMQGNEQIKKLLGSFDNNALHRPLEECLAWFTTIQNSWSIETYEQGRPYICDTNCSI